MGGFVKPAMETRGRVPIPMSLPSAITVLRIGLIPLFLLTAGACQAAARAGRLEAGLRLAAVALLLAIGASDLVDGYLARRYGLASRAGAVLDAVADKLTQVSLLFFFAFTRGPAFAAVPLWLPVLLVARDLLMATGALVLRLRRGAVRVEHRRHGKLASTLVFVLILGITSGFAAKAILAPLWLAAGVVAWSTAAYVRDGVADLRRPGPT
ncbi:MAG: CDP-alcohol phosphatidyltransferase family protein [Gemmatimonadetes bacterium]|nr:CDP-alcohol phosphatidyltransferase family protein [Gemmatimonadota bacterium]